ncbi:YezD family protein [Bacillus norwichensis]|uniref:YezD family protein n=1 Tax=Bacillus norwichensis TaxID=2762217 RepID=A0ABR8VQX1_9BACI|nr:YezD family protein [Bacillus norwichensis]MBD8007163.1 YezD family protein [Bacillus norwichensis]
MAKVDENAVNDIVSALSKLEYGSLVITVHDGEVTQIDTTEKKRYKMEAKKRKAQ